eukprot:scaffold29181_cov54-Attheya_sp.AAC.3
MMSSTPAPNQSSTRLQFTPCDDHGPNIKNPSPDKHGFDECMSPFEGYKLVMDQPLHRMLADIMYEFPAQHLHHSQDRDSIAQGFFSDAELECKFRSRGDGFTVALAIVGIKFGIWFKDILDGCIKTY